MTPPTEATKIEGRWVVLHFHCGGGGGGGGGSAPRLSPSASFGGVARDKTRVGVLNTPLKSHTNAQTRLKLADSHGDICPSNLQGVESTFHHGINSISAHHTETGGNS